MARYVRILFITALAFHALPASGYIGYFVLSNVTEPGTFCHVLDMTPDGHYLAGGCQPAVGQGYGVVRWTGLSIEFLTPPPGLNALTYAVSANGDVTGIADPISYSSFHGSGPFSILPQFEGCTFAPVGISSDSARIVGGTGPTCVPTTGNGSLILESGGYVVPEPNGRAAWAISWDGSTVVGGSPAYRWDEGTVTQLVVPGPSDGTLATGVSPDGAVVIGAYDADPTGGTDQRQGLWGPNGFMELGASQTLPTATTLPDANGVPFAVVGGHGILMGGGTNSPTIWTAPFGLESLEARLQVLFGPSVAHDHVSATGLSDDGRYVVGSFQIGAFPDEAVGFAAIIPQFRSVSAAYIGALDIGGYVRLSQPGAQPPDRLAASVDFFGTTGGTFASGMTATDPGDPFPLLEELGVEVANLQFATDPYLVWTFEYDGSLDAPLEFTTQFPVEPFVPGEEITLFHWNSDLQTWDELKRLAIDLDPEVRSLTVEIPIDAVGLGEPTHLAFGKTLSDCADDQDNDGDGKADWDGAAVGGVVLPPDPQCTSAVYAVEVNNNCGLGPELALLLPAVLALRRRMHRS